MGRKALYKMLEHYADSTALPMHMPGHKRNISAFPHLAALASGLDITEIDSFDDLNSPEDIFAESEDIASKLWQSRESVFSVNGSTCAILAAIRTVTGCKAGRTVITARNCHKSVYHGLELCACKAEYISPSLTSAGFAASVTPESVRCALDRAPAAAAVVLTSPTYEGVISDIASIAAICHERNVPLIVDEAHGAHLSLYGIFERGAVLCGADVVIQSLHKTLPSLTQTAILHVSGSLVSPRELRRQMAIFQSSSPSYLLSASIDGCVRFLLSDEGKECLRVWRLAVENTRNRMRGMENVRLFDTEEGVFAYDVSKLVLTGDGFGIMKRLRQRKVELEMASVSYAVAMTGAGDTEASLSRFADALSGISFGNTAHIGKGTLYLPKQKLSAAEAATAEAEEICLADADGRISAAYVYAYPPGVPLLVPGETVDATVIAEIQRLTAAGASVRGTKDSRISVIKRN